MGTPFFKAEKAAEAEAALAAGSEAEATADAAALLKQWRRQLVTAPFTAGEPLAEAADDEAAALLRLLRDGAGGRRAAVDALAALAAARLRTVHGGGDGDALLPLALRLLRRLLLEAAAEHASGETEALDGIGWTALADLIVELLASSVGGAHEDEALRCCVGLLQPAATRAALQPALVDALVDDAPRGRAALRRLAALLRRAPLAMRSVRGAAADDGAEVPDAMLLAAAAASGDADADDKAAAGGGASGGAAAVSLALELLALVASGPGSKVADAALQAFVGGWLLPLPTGGGEDGRGGGGRLASVLDGAGDEGGGGGGVAKEGEGEGGALSAVAACVSAVLSAGRADGAASGLGVRALEAAAALSAGPSAATQRYLGGRTRLAADCATILRDRSAPWGAAASRRMRAAAATALLRLAEGSDGGAGDAAQLALVVGALPPSALLGCMHACVVEWASAHASDGDAAAEVAAAEWLDEGLRLHQLSQLLVSARRELDDLLTPPAAPAAPNSAAASLQLLAARSGSALVAFSDGAIVNLRFKLPPAIAAASADARRRLLRALPPLPKSKGAAGKGGGGGGGGGSEDDGKLLLGALRELASTLAFEEMAFPDGTRAIARRLARPLAAARAALLTLLNLSLLLAPATPESGAAAAAGGTLDAAFAAVTVAAALAVWALHWPVGPQSPDDDCSRMRRAGRRLAHPAVVYSSCYAVIALYGVGFVWAFLPPLLLCEFLVPFGGLSLDLIALVPSPPPRPFGAARPPTTAPSPPVSSSAPSPRLRARPPPRPPPPPPPVRRGGATRRTWRRRCSRGCASAAATRAPARGRRPSSRGAPPSSPPSRSPPPSTTPPPRSRAARAATIGGGRRRRWRRSRRRCCSRCSSPSSSTPSPPRARPPTPPPTPPRAPPPARGPRSRCSPTCR